MACAGKEVACFSTLPPELQAHIVDWLWHSIDSRAKEQGVEPLESEVFECFSSLGLVNRRMAELVGAHLWKTAVVADKDLAKLELLRNKIAPRRAHNIHYLDALPQLDNYNPTLAQTHQSLPDLDELSLSPSAATTRQQLYADILQQTPNLLGIDLLLPLNNPHRSPVIPILAHNFPALKILNLHGHQDGRLGASWLGDLVGRLRGLVEVELAWVDAGARTATGDNLARALASLPKLRRLSLIQVSNFSPEWLDVEWQGPVEDLSLKWTGASEDHALAHQFFGVFASTLTSLHYAPPKPNANFNHLAPPPQSTTPLSSPQLLHLPALTNLSFHSPLSPAYLTTFLNCPLASIRFTSAPHAEYQWDSLLMILDGFEHTLEQLELRVGQPSNLGFVGMNDVAAWCWRNGIQYRLDRWEDGEEGRVIWVSD